MKDHLQDITVSIQGPSPEYITEGAAGADIRAYLEEPITLLPQQIKIIPTALFCEIPEGYEIQVRPRSGLASKGIMVCNAPGTIDSDYRGEIRVILINLGETPFTVEHRMRIAQLVLAPVVRAKFVIKEELTTTVRNQQGFGHTGVS